LLTGVLVAIYGILQHPNPLFQEKMGSTTIFHGIDHNYWAVDVENRVFSTLGQPNWLAAFLAMLIFPSVSFLLIIKKLWQKALVFIAIAVYFLAFTFTYSRGGTVGILAGLATFVILLPFFKETLWNKILSAIPMVDFVFLWQKLKNYLGVFVALLALVLVVNHFFGNALNLRGGLTTQSKSTSSTSQPQSVTRSTQLEVGGNQTAQIRTIVWAGSFEIFKHFPILGSGVETFGFSYYLFRPASHNYTSEWDFLYNKAHNEYLNYLATTGALGFLSYLFLILAFEFVAIKTIVKSRWNETRFISLGLLAGYNSYLAQNFFGFSVVPIAVLFFAFSSLFFIFNDLKSNFLTLFSDKRWSFLKSPLNNNIFKFALSLVSLYLIVSVFSLWLADFYFNKGSSSGNYQESIRDLKIATGLVPSEPTYFAELAVNLSGLAATTEDKSLAKDSAKQAREIINEVVNRHPNNTALWQSKRIVDFSLSKIDKANYLELTKTADKLKELAPTDASIQYDLALIYSYVEQNQKAEKQLEAVVKLKNDYRDAAVMLARTYNEDGKKTQAVKTLRAWLAAHPEDIEANDLLKTF
jgi:O-antigen ligase